MNNYDWESFLRGAERLFQGYSLPLIVLGVLILVGTFLGPLGILVVLGAIAGIGWMIWDFIRKG
jgi:hypothetical protein